MRKIPSVVILVGVLLALVAQAESTDEGAPAAATPRWSAVVPHEEEAVPATTTTSDFHAVLAQQGLPESPSDERTQRSTESPRWTREDDEILLRDYTGSVLRKFTLKKEEKVLEHHPEHGFTDKEFVSISGGMSANGRYAWTDRRESRSLLSGSKGANLFRYYDRDGEILWEKHTTVGVTASADGEVVALLEADPEAIAINEHGNTFARPRIYSSSGELLLDLSECRTFSDVRLTDNGRYGAVSCVDMKPKYRSFFLVFDVREKLTKELDVPGVEVHEDGTYTIVSMEQEYDPSTKMYGDFVRKEISHGRIE